MVNLNKTTFLLMATLLFHLTVSAYETEIIDGIYYYLRDNNAIVVNYDFLIGGSRIMDYSGNVTIPEEVTYDGKTYQVTGIGNYAFYGSSGLTSVTVGNSVTSIGNNAFYECRNLRTVSLPYPLKEISSSAFYYCENLTDIYCLAVTPPNMKSYDCIYPAYYMAMLHVPERSVEAYRATDWWSCFLNIVGDASEDSTIPSTPITDKCDTNGDGEVNIADVNKIIDAILSH